MGGPGTTLKASASFDVRPARSQVVLVGLTVVAIIAILVGGTLLAMDKASGWSFVLIAVALCASVVWGWRQSHRDTDLAQGHPTKVVLPDGANCSTDSRLLGSAEGVKNFAQALEALALCQPLPEPSGLTGPGAIPIANSSKEAVEQVARINANTQESHNHALIALQKQLAPESIAQPPDDGRGLPDSAKSDH